MATQAGINNAGEMSFDDTDHVRVDVLVLVGPGDVSDGGDTVVHENGDYGGFITGWRG